MNQSPLAIVDILQNHNIPTVVIGGHAVIVHGHIRATQDLDIVYLRSPESERALADALASMHAYWIGDTIDPNTGLEKTYPVDLAFVSSNKLMMLGTDYGFLDIFDFVPGLPDESVAQLLDDAIQIGGRAYASLRWLRRMKEASGRPQDRIDLENLPELPLQ